MDKEKIKLKVEHISARLGIIWSALGLIAGILFPMIYMVPMLFSSWALFASIGHNSWANSYLMINYNHPRIYITLYIIEGVVFAVGLLIFTLGLGYLVKGRHNKQKLIQNGPYRYIRHPQNLGILLMIFPFTLYIPWPSLVDPGIRTGDIVSWILMVALVCISSLIEEKTLISKMGDTYVEYRSRTGFFLPRLRNKPRKKPFALWKPVMVILGTYIVIVGLIFGVQRLLMEFGLVFWTKTF